MSKVTDIILITEIKDNICGVPIIRTSIDVINDYLKGIYNGQCLVQVDQHSGGRKATQADVFMASINRFDTVQFLNYLDTVVFESPDSVQLLIKEENQDSFALRLGTVISVLRCDKRKSLSYDKEVAALIDDREEP